MTLISDAPPGSPQFDWPKLYARVKAAMEFNGPSGGPISVGIPADAVLYLMKRSGVQIRPSCMLHETVKKK